jgi:membrane-associated phospholipid phosphatase
MAGKIKLNDDEMLQSEFKYITQNAFQANEDRSRFSSYYFVTVGSFVAAILGSPSAVSEKTVALAFFILFATLTIMGSFTLAQLARLRAAWHEAVEAMNQIKKFYIDNNKKIRPAFKWLENIPPTNKPNSIANLIATEVALLSSLTAGSGIYFLLTATTGINVLSWLIIFLGSFANYNIQMARYKKLLVDDHA